MFTGITYFLMPAIFDSLVVHQGLSAHVAWRVAFIVPFIIITAVAITMLLVCPDTPTGPWSQRHLAVAQNLASHGITGDIVDVPGAITDNKNKNTSVSHSAGSSSPGLENDESKLGFTANTDKITASGDHEAQVGEQSMLDTARGEIITKPSFKEAGPVLFSLQTLVTCGCYFCSFGAELAINSILGAYYLQNFKGLGQTGSGRWAAMFGLLNFVFRPIGGMLSDFLYARTGVWGKKWLVHALAVATGVLQIAIGVANSDRKSTMMGLVAGMALFLEAGNGALFALVPHVHPHANGLVSGCTGAAGNLGGIVFAIVFRELGKDYGKVVWIIGVVTIAVNVSVSWIRPIPRGQIGGQ